MKWNIQWITVILSSSPGNIRWESPHLLQYPLPIQHSTSSVVVALSATSAAPGVATLPETNSSPWKIQHFDGMKPRISMGIWDFHGLLRFVSGSTNFKETNLGGSHFPLNHDCGRKSVLIYINWKSRLFGKFNVTALFGATVVDFFPHWRKHLSSCPQIEMHMVFIQERHMPFAIMRSKMQTILEDPFNFLKTAILLGLSKYFGLVAMTGKLENPCLDMKPRFRIPQNHVLDIHVSYRFFLVKRTKSCNRLQC